MENNEEIDLREIFATLRRRWKTVALFTGLCTAAAVAYCLMATPMYESVMVLQVPRSPNARFEKDATQAKVTAYKEAAVSSSVVLPLVKEFGEPDSKGKLPGVEAFAKRYIKVTSERNSDVFKVTVMGKSPEQARGMNYKLLSGINTQFTKIINGAQQDREKMLSQRVNESSGELVKVRRELDAMYHANGDLNPVDEADQVSALIAKAYQNRKENDLAIRQATNSLREVEEQLRRLPRAEITNESVRDIQKWLTELEFERNMLAVEKPGSAKVAVMDKKIASARQQIYEEQERILQGKVLGDGTRYAGLYDEKYALQQELMRRRNDEQYWTEVIRENELKIKSLLEKKRGYETLTENEAKLKSYNKLVTDSLQKLQAEGNRDSGRVSIIGEPSYNERPVSPRRVRISGVAMILGAILSSLYVIMKEKM